MYFFGFLHILKTQNCSCCVYKANKQRKFIFTLNMVISYKHLGSAKELFSSSSFRAYLIWVGRSIWFVFEVALENGRFSFFGITICLQFFSFCDLLKNEPLIYQFSPFKFLSQNKANKRKKIQTTFFNYFQNNRTIK